MTTVEIQGERLTLLPQKAIYWFSREMLVVSDIHLGKAGHFRKNGIAVSRKVHLHDIANLEKLILSHKPQKILFLGDLFHSTKNVEWNDFLNFMDRHPTKEFTLVVGNHDILREYPAQMNLTEQFDLAPFSFTHIREESPYYNISGHIHPGISVREKSRMGFTIPCFLISKTFAILPAFGQFTGLKKVFPNQEDRIYGVAEESVMKLC